MVRKLFREKFEARQLQGGLLGTLKLDSDHVIEARNLSSCQELELRQILPDEAMILPQMETLSSLTSQLLEDSILLDDDVPGQEGQEDIELEGTINLDVSDVHPEPLLPTVETLPTFTGQPLECSDHVQGEEVEHEGTIDLDQSDDNAESLLDESIVFLDDQHQDKEPESELEKTINLDDSVEFIPAAQVPVGLGEKFESKDDSRLMSAATSGFRRKLIQFVQAKAKQKTMNQADLFLTSGGLDGSEAADLTITPFAYDADHGVLTVAGLQFRFNDKQKFLLCMECGLRFQYRDDNTTGHLRTYESLRNHAVYARFSCSKCSKIVHTESQLRQHFKMQHEIESSHLEDSSSSSDEETDLLQSLQEEDSSSEHEAMVGISLELTAGPALKQFQSILHAMEIPEDEFKLSSAVVRDLEQKLEKPLRLPKCSVELYRQNFLKLRNNFRSEVYWVFLYISNETHGDFQGITKSKWIALDNYLSAIGRRSSDDHSVLGSLSILTEGGKPSDRLVNGTRLVHPSSGLQFHLTYTPLVFGELQLSKLTSYYCEFDARVKSLLSLLYYWAETNSVLLSSDAKITPSQDALDPATLEWLLLFHLYQKEKIVPIPEEILERPHVSVTVHLPTGSVDLGFNADLDFARRWQKRRKVPSPPCFPNNEFLLSILEYLQKFFKFYGETLPTRCLLSSRDGKIHAYEKNEKPPKFVVLNPFVSEWRLGLDNDRWLSCIRPAMRHTADKLGDLVDSLRNWIASKLQEKPFEKSLRKALWVDRFNE